jgi:hypothetical protein
MDAPLNLSIKEKQRMGGFRGWRITYGAMRSSGLIKTKLLIYD